MKRSSPAWPSSSRSSAACPRVKVRKSTGSRWRNSTAAGQAAAQSRDYATAVRRYAAAIRAAMLQIRQFHLTTTDDSGVYIP